jgi:hypothetical protein
MNAATITNTYAIKDADALADCIKLMSLSSVAKESQSTSCGVMPVVFAGADVEAVRKLQSDLATSAESPDVRFYAATMTRVRGTLTGPIILNTSNANWLPPIVAVGNVTAARRVDDDAASSVKGEEPIAGAVVEWKGETREVARTMGLIQLVHRYATLACALFNVIGPVNVQASNDPETDDRYLAIGFRVSGSVDEVVASEERFQTAAVREFPMDKLFHLRLSYDLM